MGGRKNYIAKYDKKPEGVDLRNKDKRLLQSLLKFDTFNQMALSHDMCASQLKARVLKAIEAAKGFLLQQNEGHTLRSLSAKFPITKNMRAELLHPFLPYWIGVYERMEKKVK